MKKTGIVCDDYKLTKFKEELEKAGFTNLEIKPFTKNTTAIFVQIEESQQNKLTALCVTVESYFKRRN